MLIGIKHLSRINNQTTVIFFYKNLSITMLKPNVTKEGKVNGSSIVFSLRHPMKWDEKNKNLLVSHIITDRVPKARALSCKKKLFFVENTNLHNLPSRCTGVLVAYSPHHQKASKLEITQLRWFLGTVISHTYDKTVIAPTNVNPESFGRDMTIVDDEKSLSSTHYQINTECPVVFNTFQFHIRYLNAVTHKNDSDECYHISTSILGPDRVPISASIRIAAKKFQESNPLLPDGILTIAINKVIRSHGLLGVLYQYKKGMRDSCSSKKFSRNTMAQIGTHVVEIEGPTEKLRDGLDPSSLVIPLLEEDDITSSSCPKLHKYVYVPRAVYKQLAKGGRRNANHLNKELKDISGTELTLTKFDLNTYPNGLIFVFRQSDEYRVPTIVREFKTTTIMEHCQFNGTVMSHWTVSQNTYTISKKIITIMEDVFGGNGFNRKSVNSIGINVYIGEKSSSRAVANPL